MDRTVIFAETLRQIESLPDTEGGGTSVSRQERNERIEFAYARRDTLTTLLIKTQLWLQDTERDIQRLTEEERVELADEPKISSLRRRATDIITRRKR